MPEEIGKIVAAIQRAGGKVKPSALLKSKNAVQRREMQKALQSALDRGEVRLDSDMYLTVVQRHQAHAA